MPQILNYNISNILLQLLQFIFGAQSQASTTSNVDTTFYMVTMADADPAQQDVTSMAFLVSLILRAASSDNFDVAKEAQQFVVDLHRNKVRENGSLIKIDDGAAILNRWAHEVAAQTGLPEGKVRAVLTTLNQGAGYGAVAGMLSEGGTKEDKPVIFSANFRSIYSKSLFERNGSTFTYYRSIPLHALSNDPEHQLDTEPNPEQPDVIVTTKVTIRMHHFELHTYQLENQQPSFAIIAKPGAVTQTSAVQTRDAAIKFNSSNLPRFADCEVMGFHMVPDTDLVSDLTDNDWVMTPRLQA